MNEKQYKLPAIIWLKVTDYMHGWLQRDLGCAYRIGDKRVVCAFDVPGVLSIMMMETVKEKAEQKIIGNSISAVRRNCIESGLEVDREATIEMYGLTDGLLDLFVPVECPKRCLTSSGVLRPWTLDVNLSPRQATALQRALRQAFWDAVGAFNSRYARMMGGRKYPAVDMIEAFCAETETPDLYVEAMRREWQRRVKRVADRDGAAQ